MNSFYEKTKGDYLISTDPSKLNVEVIHNYLSQESYWAKDIPFETVKKIYRTFFMFWFILFAGAGWFCKINNR